MTLDKAYAVGLMSSNFETHLLQQEQYAGFTRDQVLDGFNEFVDAYKAGMNKMFAREVLKTMRWGDLPDVPEKVRPNILLGAKTNVELATGRNGVVYLDQYDQGADQTSCAEELDRIAGGYGVTFDQYWATIDKWSQDPALRNVQNLRIACLFILDDAGGWAGGSSGFANIPDQDKTWGHAMVGSWGISFYITKRYNHGAMAIYGVGVAGEDPIKVSGHEGLHGLGVDSHFPKYLELRDDCHWAPEQVQSFIAFNHTFLDDVPPPPPPPEPIPPEPVVERVWMQRKDGSSSLTLKVGQTVDFDMWVDTDLFPPERVTEDTNATYTVSDQNIATVDQYGRVTARRSGTVTLAGRYSYWTSSGPASMDAKLYLTIRKRKWWELW